MNVRGVRIGPSEIYRALAAGVPEVAEAMAVEQRAPDEIGGSRLVLLVMLREGWHLNRDFENRIRSELRTRCSAVHVPSVIVEVADLPTTHSGKRSERAARDALNGVAVENVRALRNPECLEPLSRNVDIAAGLLHAQVDAPVGALTSESEILSTLLDLWGDALKVGPIGPDDVFFEVGGDSLAGLSLLISVEKVFGQRLLMSSLLEQASTPALMAKCLLSPQEEESTHLVPIKMSGSLPPVFWLPGGGGLSVFSFRDISYRLGERQPVYGFEARPRLSDAEPDLQSTARKYVRDLLEAFPRGPYLFLGFSAGSWTAFEMSVQLQQLGEEVPLLCLFDSPLPFRHNLFAKMRIL